MKAVWRTSAMSYPEITSHHTPNSKNRSDLTVAREARSLGQTPVTQASAAASAPNATVDIVFPFSHDTDRLRTPARGSRGAIADAMPGYRRNETKQ